MQDFRSLKVWQKGHQVTLAVYKATTKFPKEELFGLTSQMRRSAAGLHFAFLPRKPAVTDFERTRKRDFGPLKAGLLTRIY